MRSSDTSSGNQSDDDEKVVKASGKTKLEIESQIHYQNAAILPAVKIPLWGVLLFSLHLLDLVLSAVLSLLCHPFSW